MIFFIACSKEQELPVSGLKATETESEADLTRSAAEAWASGLLKEATVAASSATDVSPGCSTMPNYGVTYANGMLCFPSSAAFKGTYAVLACQAENYAGYDAYMTLYSGDLYKIDSALDAKGIDEEKPLTDFENKYAGYFSLRRQLNNEEESFLAAGGDPAYLGMPGVQASEAHASDDVVFNTLLNAQGCLKVGDTIVKIFPNGVSYLITDGSMTTLSQLTDQYAFTPYSATNVIALWNEDTTSVNRLMACGSRLNHKTSDAPICYPYSYKGKNYKMYNQVKVTNVPFFHGYTALAKNFVWKNNRWKKARIYLFANVKQDLTACPRVNQTNARFPTSGYKYRRHVRAIYKSNIFHLLNQGTITYNNTLYIVGERGNLRAVNGLKYGNTSITRTVILSW